MDMVSRMMAYEEGEMDDGQVLELFSELVKSGQAWQLQGSYGRQAARLIGAGYLGKDGTILMKPELEKPKEPQKPAPDALTEKERGAFDYLAAAIKQGATALVRMKVDGKDRAVLAVCKVTPDPATGKDSYEFFNVAMLLGDDMKVKLPEGAVDFNKPSKQGRKRKKSS